MNRILVIKPSSLGDLFHALPTVHLIKQHTGAAIDWVANQAYAPLVECFDPVDRVLSFPRHDFWRNRRTFLRELRRESYDLVLDMQGLMKSAIIARSARAARILGPSFHREGSRWLYHEVAGKKNKNRHAVDENLDMLDALDIPRGEVAFPVTFPAPELPSTNGPHIGVIPCSRWETKNWPVSHFVAACEQLIRDAGASVHLFGAPEDAEACRELEQKLAGAVVNHCGTTALPALGGWLRAMDLVLCVDTGPMHMAAAVGTPILAVFGATDARRTGPYGSQHRVIVREDLPCRPCLSRTCQLREKDIRCLNGLDPARVAEAALACLS